MDATSEKIANEMQVLEKALEIACEELNTYSGIVDNAEFDDYRTQEEWKDWALELARKEIEDE